MPTQKQKQATIKIMENGGNISKGMRDAGYSPRSSKNPKNLTESKGYKEICDEVGLTDNLIISSLVEDIKAKPGNRKSELELAAKIKGYFSKEKEVEDSYGSFLSSLHDALDADEALE